MPVFNNLDEAEAALVKYIPIVKEMTGKDITLDRIGQLMAAVGNPQNELRIVHVAGTSGKTSTAYYVASLLQASEQKVGLTVSPHVDSITERLQIDGRPVSDEEFCRALGEFMDLIQAAPLEPSYFELLIAFAYWYFAKEKVGYAVIETGMGGLHDGTNIAQRADKVCVITDIGLDHTHILGDTLEAIAAQKAGIMHSGNQAFMYRQTPSVTKVFEDYARQQSAKLQVLTQADLVERYRLAGWEQLPLFQQRNWLLARAVSQFVAERDGWQLTDEVLQESLAVEVPGRMEVRRIGGKTVIMDGAHNQQKIEAFVRSFRRQYPDKQVPILLALKQGKEYETVLPLLQPLYSQLLLTTFDVLQDLPARSIDPTILADKAAELGYEKVQIINDPAQAFEALMRLPDELVVVTGSFYLLSCIRPLIINA